MFSQDQDVVYHECYMDDTVLGASSVAEAIKKQSQLVELFKVSGVSLRK